MLTPARPTKFWDDGLVVDKGELSVLMITHKFREVMKFADEVTVLRSGKFAGQRPSERADAARWREMMIGSARAAAVQPTRTGTRGTAAAGARKSSQRTTTSAPPPSRISSLDVHAGEIVGVAGVSGNGQRELVEVLAGQRGDEGQIDVEGEIYRATARRCAATRCRCLPEEPLKNACVGGMSVADNMALPRFRPRRRSRSADGRSTARPMRDARRA